MVQVAIPIEPGSSGSPALDFSVVVIAILSIKSVERWGLEFQLMN